MMLTEIILGHVKTCSFYKIDIERIEDEDGNQ